MLLECGDYETDSSVVATATGTEFGQIVVYSCAEGYDNFSGDRNRTCQSNGEWTGSAPTCSAIGTCDLIYSLKI